MRKFLQALSPEWVARIARDLGCTSPDRKTQTAFVIDRAVAYGLRASDFQARYPEIPQ